MKNRLEVGSPKTEAVRTNGNNKTQQHESRMSGTNNLAKSNGIW